MRFGLVPVRCADKLNVAVAGQPASHFVLQHFLAAFGVSGIGSLTALHRFESVKAGLYRPFPLSVVGQFYSRPTKDQGLGVIGHRTLSNFSALRCALPHSSRSGIT